MTRYKVRLPDDGEVLYGDGGEYFAVADNDALAREILGEHTDEPPVFVHALTARFSAVYKRDIDACDAFDGAEPGDTMWRIFGGEPDGPNDVRVWAAGAPRLARWRMAPVPPEPVSPADIPIGVRVHHHRLGSGRTLAPGRKVHGWWYLDVAWGWPTATSEKACKVSLLSVLPSLNWPRPVYRLEIDGERVADGGEDALRTLVDIREARLRAEWEAEQFDALVRGDVAA